MKLAIRPLAPCGPGCAHAATPADPPAPCDLAFVAASWSGAWHQPPEASLVTTVAWRAAVWASVPAIVARPDVRVLVAADGDAADHRLPAQALFAKSTLDQPATSALRAVLQTPAWQERMHAMPGYAPMHCGEVLAMSTVLPWWRFSGRKRSAGTRQKP